MNIKALLKALRLRKFATALLLLQLSLTIGLMVNTVILTNSAIKKLNKPLHFDVEQLIAVDLIPTSGAYRDTDYYQSITKHSKHCLLYTSPSPRDGLLSRMPSSA